MNNLEDFGETFKDENYKEHLIVLSKLTMISIEPTQTHVVGIIYGDDHSSSFMISMLTNQSFDEVMDLHTRSSYIVFRGVIDPSERYTDRQGLKVSPLRGNLFSIDE